MGNQEIKQAMSRMQRKDFNPTTQLNPFEEMLWN